MSPTPRACARSTGRSPCRGDAGFWRKLFAFAGPGYLVAVGYMDPGNWATDLAGGARYGYTLLSVILISNLMAILLQALAVRLGHCQRTRPRAGLPRQLLEARHDRALGALRDRDRRVRSGGGHRRRHRAQPALRPAAHLGRVHSPRSTCWSILFLQHRGFRYVEALVVGLIVGDRRMLCD